MDNVKRIRTRYLVRDVRSVGFRVGYWPCVKGPFLQINYGKTYRSYWYGLPLTTVVQEP